MQRGFIVCILKLMVISSRQHMSIKTERAIQILCVIQNTQYYRKKTCSQPWPWKQCVCVFWQRSLYATARLLALEPERRRRARASSGSKSPSIFTMRVSSSANAYPQPTTTAIHTLARRTYACRAHPPSPYRIIRRTGCSRARLGYYSASDESSRAMNIIYILYASCVYYNHHARVVRNGFWHRVHGRQDDFWHSRSTQQQRVARDDPLDYTHVKGPVCLGPRSRRKPPSPRTRETLFTFFARLRILALGRESAVASARGICADGPRGVSSSLADLAVMRIKEKGDVARVYSSKEPKQHARRKQLLGIWPSWLADMYIQMSAVCVCVGARWNVWAARGAWMDLGGCHRPFTHNRAVFFW